jgi:hypothetical protein
VFFRWGCLCNERLQLCTISCVHVVDDNFSSFVLFFCVHVVDVNCSCLVLPSASMQSSTIARELFYLLHPTSCSRKSYHSALISDHSECVQRFLIKASLCSNGCSLSNSENAEQKPLGHSFEASFKRAYTALHDFERE